LTRKKKPLIWRQPADMHVWASLYSSFNDLSTLRSPKWGENAPHLDCARSVVTAYQGLLHSVLIDAWVPLFKAPCSVVVSVAYQFIRRLDRDALARLWKKRCEVTIAWEKERVIRPKMKRQAQQGQPGTTRHAILLPDTCSCGALLNHHLQGPLPRCSE